MALGRGHIPWRLFRGVERGDEELRASECILFCFRVQTPCLGPTFVSIQLSF